jgi:hypothetical protein
MPEHDLDTNVKLAIYQITAETGRIPNSSAVSQKIDIDESEVVAAFSRLHVKPSSSRAGRSEPDSNGASVLRNCDRISGGSEWQELFRELRLGRLRNRGRFALRRSQSRLRWSHWRAINARSEKRPAGFKTVRRAFCRTGSALVGQSYFYVSNDVALPVGRDRQSVVRVPRSSATPTGESYPTMATRCPVVRESADCRIAPARAG